MSKKAWILMAFTALAGFLAVGACRSGSLESSQNELLKMSETPTNTPFQPVPAATITPSPPTGATHTPGPEETQDNGEEEMITIRVVFDNYPYMEGLTTSWGFSAFIRYKDHNLLFDSGGSGGILLNNLRTLNISPGEIQSVVLSHEHSDHTGGMQGLLASGAKPVIYLLPSFSPGIKNQLRQQAVVVEVAPSQKITERIYSTGQIQGSPPEQALVIDTTRGLVVITGCAHPGVVNMVRAAKQAFKEEIYLVLGGFHLGSASSQQVQGIIRELKALGVSQVAPCHCTGDQAISQFREAFGDKFLKVGVGALIEIPQ